MSRYIKILIIPCVVILVCGYIIGYNHLCRTDRTNEQGEITLPASATNGNYKTEEEEDRELKAIEDKININTAQKSELMLLDGIGETYAERIIELREKLGSFNSIEQIKDIDGIGDSTYNRIKDYITVE